jgi:hypothetical protein
MPYHYGYKYNTAGKVKPDLMVIADSYYWTIYNLHDSHLLWDEHDFRYYDVQAFSPGETDKELSLISIEELKRFDFIMVVYTEMNLHVLANMFFEKCYAVLYEAEELDIIKDRIRKDKGWLKNIQEKADRKGITLEKQLDMDAMWILTQEMKKQDEKTNKE